MEMKMKKMKRREIFCRSLLCCKQEQGVRAESNKTEESG
jgi:hypothetical protein